MNLLRIKYVCRTKCPVKRFITAFKPDIIAGKKTELPRNMEFKMKLQTNPRKDPSLFADVLRAMLILAAINGYVSFLANG